MWITARHHNFTASASQESLSIRGGHVNVIALPFFTLSPTPARRQTRHTRIPLLTLRLERNLDPELLLIGIKPRPILVLPSIDLSRLQFETASLVRFCSNQHVLERLVRGVVDFLLEGAHEANPRHHVLRDLGVLKLEEKTLLPCDRVASLGDLVAWSSDLDDVALDLYRVCAGVCFVFLLLAQLRFLGSTPCEIGLMLAPLSVSEVRAIILVDCQAEAALEAPDVVLEEVGVLVEVDGFERELSQSFSSVGVGC